MAGTIARLQGAVEALAARLAGDAARSSMVQGWVAAGVPEPLAARVASALHLLDALDIAEVAEATRRGFDEVCEVHAAVAHHLGLARLRRQIESLPGGSYWPNRAKSALGDELASVQRTLAQQVLDQDGGMPRDLLSRWKHAHAASLERTQRLLGDIAESRHPDLAMLSVAMRELRGLA
jgi:glutamate dehydrogenase